MFKSNQNIIELELIRRARDLTLHKDSVFLHGPPSTDVTKILSCSVPLFTPFFPSLPLLTLSSLIAVNLGFLLNFCCEYIFLRRLFLVARDVVYFTFSQDNSVIVREARINLRALTVEILPLSEVLTPATSIFLTRMKDGKIF